MRRTGLVYLVLLLAGQAAQASDCRAPGALRYEPRTFLGYACEDDCEEHKAGFLWGERHRLADPSSCASLARAQAEGCRVYVAESHAVEAAGRRWAIENEVARGCDCDGAGERFRAGCARELPPASRSMRRPRLRRSVATARRAVSLRASRPVKSAR